MQEQDTTSPTPPPALRLRDLAQWLGAPISEINATLQPLSDHGLIFRAAIWRFIQMGVAAQAAEVAAQEAEDRALQGQPPPYVPEKHPRTSRIRYQAERLRPAVIARDGRYCRYCGRRLVGTVFIDHVIPVSAGGQSTLENLVVSCHPCNSHKGHRHPSLVGFTLKPPRGHGEGPQPSDDYW